MTPHIDPPDTDPDLLDGELPCDTPGCTGIAYGEVYPWACYCHACVARMPVCETEGCIDQCETFEAFAEFGSALRKVESMRLWLAECSCGKTAAWPMVGNPGRGLFMASRRAQ